MAISTKAVDEQVSALKKQLDKYQEEATTKINTVDRYLEVESSFAAAKDSYRALSKSMEPTIEESSGRVLVIKSCMMLMLFLTGWMTYQLTFILWLAVAAYISVVMSAALALPVQQLAEHLTEWMQRLAEQCGLKQEWFKVALRSDGSPVLIKEKKVPTNKVSLPVGAVHNLNSGLNKVCYHIDRIVSRATLVLLFDIGRVVAKVWPGAHPDTLLKQYFQWRGQTDRWNLHSQMRDIQNRLNGISKALLVEKKTLYSATKADASTDTTASSTQNQDLYHLMFISLSALRHRVFNRQIGWLLFWSGLPFIVSAQPHLSSLIIALNFTFPQLFGGSYYARVIEDQVYDLFRYPVSCVLVMRFFSLFFYPKEKSLDGSQVKHALSPRRFDGYKMLRGFLYTWGRFVMSFWPILSWSLLLNVASLKFWLISVFISCIYISIQTLYEELEFRRSAADPNQGWLALLANLVLGPLLFGYLHLLNPEFNIFAGNKLAVLAKLSGYTIDGFFWALCAYLSGGIELSWGMHFANNLFFCTMIGYTPCVMPAIPLLTIKRNRNHYWTKKLLKINTYGQVAAHWAAGFYASAISWLGVYFFELCHRPQYDVTSADNYISTDQLKAAEIERHKSDNEQTKATSLPSTVDYSSKSTNFYEWFKQKSSGYFEDMVLKTRCFLML